MFWVFFLLFLGTVSGHCPDRCSCKENERLVDCSHLDLSYIPQGIPESTKVLNLRGNRLVKLQSKDVENLKNVEMIILANNHIKYIEENILDNLPELRRLNLGHNRLTKLVPLASQHSLLLSLNLRHNHLAHIQSQVFTPLRNLVQLDLGHNRLQSLHAQIVEDLEHTQSIILSGNPWHCDCRILNLAKRFHIKTEDHPRCFNPSVLRGQILSKVVNPKCKTPLVKVTGDQKILECPNDEVTDDKIVWLFKNLELDYSPLPTYEMSSPNSLIIPQKQDASEIACTHDAPIVPYRKRRQLRGTAPVITFATTDRSYRLGQRIQLHCEVQGSPQPEVRWYKNNRPYNPNSRNEFSHNNTIISIYSFWETDIATYKCVVSNAYGTIEKEMKVGLINSVSPLITDGPHDQTVDIGQQVTFRCISKGVPRPIHTWMFNGAPISNIKGRIFVSADTTELTIKSVRRSDRGVFICAANNPVGTMGTGALLEIRGYLADQLNNVLTDETIKHIAAKAITNVNRAVDKTQKLRKKKISKPEELHRHIQHIMPEEVVELNRAREIYEESFRLVNEYVEEGLQLSVNELSPNISYESILSAGHMQTLMNASGCIAGSAHLDSCADVCYHQKYRSYDGQCNNLANPMWGVSSMPFLRLLPPVYENGFNTPVGWDKTKLYFGFPKPNPREVSRQVISAPKITAHGQFSSMVMQWGQFLDHDITFAATALSRHNFKTGSLCNKTCENSTPCFNIPLAPNDPKLLERKPDQIPCIEFERNAAVCGSGETSTLFDKVTYRDQMNIVTSFVDASMVYGSTEQHALELRDRFRDDGLLRFDTKSEANKEYMPFERDSPMDCRRNFSSENPIRCFLSGDFRANEQQGLTVMHTLFVREHNRIARKLKIINKHWSGDTIYQETRKIMGAIMQHITYKEWLPIVLGQEAMNDYNNLRYDPKTHPGISNAFATAAFRFGHTLINPVLQRLDKNFREVKEGHLPLHKAFFAPAVILYEGGIDPLLRGLFASPIKKPKNTEIMNFVLTEKLFHRYHQASLDLAVMNIQRGRDHGLPSYTEYRGYCNLPVPKNWDDMIPIVQNAAVIQKLRLVYGDPGNIDLFVGGVVELLLPDALIGPTFHCIINEQFKRLQTGDRFWYENPETFTPHQLAELRKISLSRIICDNGDDIDRIQKNAFQFVGESPSNYGRCSDLPEINLDMWRSAERLQCSINKNNILSRKKRTTVTKRNCIHDSMFRMHGEVFLEKYDTNMECRCENGSVSCVSKRR